MSFEVVTIGDATRIYSLVDPRNGETRYVGKTVRSLRARLLSHRQAAKRGKLPVNNWVRKTLPINCGAIINWLETVPAGEDWAARESFWISEMRRRGARLLNLTEGGEGLPGHVFSQAHRQKIAQKLRKGAEFTCACGNTFWRKPGEIKKGNAKFCSKACYQTSNKGVSKPMPRGIAEHGVTAAREKKLSTTNCKYGHPLSGANLFINSNGARCCKECRKGHKRAYLARLEK